MTRNRGKNNVYHGGWFRFYRDALNDPKVQTLSPHLYKTWVNLLCLAAQDTSDNGLLPNDERISFALRMSVNDTRLHVDDLILAGLIDILPGGTRQPHNWLGRQPKKDRSVHRMRKHRARKAAKQKGDADVTRHETEGVTDE